MAEAITAGAGAEGIVEGEKTRLDFRNGKARNRAGKFLAHDETLGLALIVFLIGIFDDGNAVGQIERCFKTFSQSCRPIGSDNQTVNYNIDVMLEFFIQARRFGNLDEFAVDLGALKTLF